MAYTAETFREFWANPDLPAHSEDIHDEVLGYWPGTDEPVRGRDEYLGKVHDLLERVPDLTVRVEESADDGEHLFIRWVAHATNVDGERVEQSGVDRIKVQDGKVVENRIFFDRAQFEQKLGKSLEL